MKLHDEVGLAQFFAAPVGLELVQQLKCNIGMRYSEVIFT
jgi:hypothetical protein